MNSPSKCILTIAMAIFAFSIQAQVPALSSYPSSRATNYLQFFGQRVEGTIWNSNGPIDAKAAALSVSEIKEIFQHIAEDYQAFNLNITTDSNVFIKAPILQRMRIIFSSTNSWFGNTSGASAVGSFSWGDNTPAWVFCNMLGNNVKLIGDAASHEIGHTLGLQHQSLYDQAGKKISEYNGGEGWGENGWAPIMGVSYYKAHSGWFSGSSTLGYANIQNDQEIIAGSPNNFGFRMSGVISDSVISTDLLLTGYQRNSQHFLNWRLPSTDSLDHVVIEFAADGARFRTLTILAPSIRHFSFSPPANGDLNYRIKAVWSSDENEQYSNTISLNAAAIVKQVRILNNQISELFTVKSEGNFNYQLLEVDGRIVAKGQLHPGINQISAQNASKGILLFHWEDQSEQGIEKLMKQ